MGVPWGWGGVGGVPAVLAPLPGSFPSRTRWSCWARTGTSTRAGGTRGCLRWWGRTVRPEGGGCRGVGSPLPTYGTPPSPVSPPGSRGDKPRLSPGPRGTQDLLPSWPRSAVASPSQPGTAPTPKKKAGAPKPEPPPRAPHPMGINPCASTPPQAPPGPRSRPTAASPKEPGSPRPRGRRRTGERPQERRGAGGARLGAPPGHHTGGSGRSNKFRAVDGQRLLGAGLLWPSAPLGSPGARSLLQGRLHPCVPISVPPHSLTPQIHTSLRP